MAVNNISDSYIKVKTSGGGFVNMPLNQVKALKNKMATSDVKTVPASAPAAPAAPAFASAAPVKKVLEPAAPKPPAPAKKTTAVPASTPASTSASTPASTSAPAKKWTRADSQSLLEEKLPPAADNEGGSALVSNTSNVSSARDEQVKKVVSSLPFKLSPVAEKNLTEIVRLCLKDIYDPTKTIEKLTAQVAGGGAQLTLAQARAVLSACQTMLKLNSKDDAAAKQRPVKPFKKNVLSKNKALIETDTTATRPYTEPALPSNTTPFNSFVHKPLKNEPVKNDPLKHEQLKLNSQVAPARPTLNDISAPPSEMGPVEELKYVTLIDFRRLSANAIEAAARLKQKIINLRDESYLLYMQAVDAWHQSPLYNDYISAAMQSLTQRKPLSALLTDKKSIQLAEIKALIKMENEI